MKYVKHPIPVEAFLWRGEVSVPGMPVGTIHDIYEQIPDGPVGGLIDTLEGRRLEIRSGEHYIVGPGAGGEFWPVRKDIFEATYQLVPGQHAAACALFPDPHDERDPVADLGLRCTCGAEA